MARDMCVAPAAVKLMMRYPFWCELYYTLKVVETRAIPTLATNGVTLWVNPEFWDTLTFDLKVSALAHEVCHKMLHHNTRGRHHKQPWRNIAMDIVVNTMLADNGFKIGPTWVQPQPKMKGWTYEAVYDEITKHLQQPPPPPQGGGGEEPPPEEDDGDEEQPGGGAGEPDDEDGDGTEDDDQGDGAGGEEDDDEEGDDAGSDVGGDSSSQPSQGKKDGKGKGQGDPKEPHQEGSGYCDDPGVPKEFQGAWKDVLTYEGSQEEIEAFEEKVEQQVQQAIAAAKAMGHAPAGVEMAVEQTMKVAKEQWFDHLRRFFHSLRLAEYDWMKLNRRFLKHRVLVPTQYTERLGEVVVFIDASGSCYTPAQQEEFTSHVNSILSEAMPSRTHVAWFDTIVHKHYEIEPGELDLNQAPKGGGGTSFTDLIPWMERQCITPEVVIVLTDMYGTFPQEEPGYPVIWASTSPGVVAPIGETIFIHERS